MVQRRLLRVDSSRNIDSFADLSLNDSSDDDNQGADTNAAPERMELTPEQVERPRRAKKRKSVSKWANMAMYAEPLDFTSIPEDLHTDWIALAPVPKGKRCIMATSRSSKSSELLISLWFSPLTRYSIRRIPPQSGQGQHSDATSNKSTVGHDSRLHTR
jgi:hypothetical protein